MLDHSIIEVNDSNIASLEELSEEALEESYSFVKKAIDEWNSGINSFSKPGEKLWGIFINGRCIAIGGLNQDPYLEDSTIGRVRHVYVSKNYREQGFAKILMKHIVGKAKDNFRMLRLSTSNPAAASLYESFGFVKQEGYKVTHTLDLV